MTLPDGIVEAVRDAVRSELQGFITKSEGRRAAVAALSAIPLAELVAALRTLEADNTGETIDGCYCQECDRRSAGAGPPSHYPECPFAILSHPRVKVMP